MTNPPNPTPPSLAPNHHPHHHNPTPNVYPRLLKTPSPPSSPTPQKAHAARRLPTSTPHDAPALLPPVALPDSTHPHMDNPARSIVIDEFAMWKQLRTGTTGATAFTNSLVIGGTGSASGSGGLRAATTDRILLTDGTRRGSRGASRGVPGGDGGALNCVVCFGSGADARRMRVCPLCFVATCHDCFAAWLEVRVRAGYSAHLSCMRCVASVSPDEVRAFCGWAVYRRHMYYLSRERQRGNSDAIWCPREGCWRLLTEERVGDGDEVECVDCGATVCVKCRAFGHGGKECPAPHFDPGQRVLVQCWQWMNTKKCPKCGVRIQRAGGCSQMRCTSCHTKFCWRCRGILHASPLVNARGKPLRLCVCPRSAEAAVVLTAIGAVVLAAPLAVAAAVVVGPPALVIYVALPGEKKEAVRARVTNFLSRF